MTGQQRSDEPPSHRKWVIIGGAVLLALVVGFFALRGVSRVAGDSGDAAKKAILLIGLNAGAKQIRDRAPIKLDSVTTLTDATVEDDRIIYTVSVNYDVPKSELASTQAELQASNAKDACADADIRELVAVGGKMRWVYTDRDGDRLETNLLHCP